MRTIHIVDWRADFITGIGRFTLDLDPTSTVVLFPHNRPARHLRAWYQGSLEVTRPRLLPEMSSFDGFVTGLRRRLTDRALVQAGKLDQVGLLFETATALGETTDGPLSRLPLNADAFFPWGVRLASLVEELLRQGVTPRNLAHMSGEVMPFAAALLAQLGELSERYVRGLEDRGWTTPGLDHRYLSVHLDRVADELAGTTVVAAGFYALSGTERALFKHLWDAGELEVLWHTDPQLAEGAPGMAEVRLHRDWLNGWSARADLIGPQPERQDGPELSFVEGFDLHSQLHALAALLAEQDESGGGGTGESAIVLPETGALIPVLHHLPQRELNISMGYPLERTGLYQLVDRLLTLQQRRDRSGGYFWRDLLALIRHPYLKMLSLPDGSQPLRRVFRVHEQAVRSGEKYQDPAAWMPPYTEPPLDEMAEGTEDLRREVLDVCLNGFSGLGSLAELADALSRLADLLAERGAGVWKRFVIDAEYLSRLTGSVIPELRTAAFARLELDQATLFAVLRQLCRAERVSFEPEPLTGLQVMGVLETRLLSFRQLFVLDATEERLPGTAPFDPLLPDPLRNLLGLPDARERDHVSAYNFKRLLMGAHRAVLLYQSGVQPGLFDSKSVRSRFVEQLIWEKEKRERRGKELITPGQDPIRVVHFPATPLPCETAPVVMDEVLRESMREHLRVSGLSASRLDTWLTCPKRYYFRHLAKLEPLAEVLEAGDRAALGTVVHQALQEFFEPHLGRDLDPSLLDPGALTDLTAEIMLGDERLRQASWDVRQALAMTLDVRLHRFLSHQEPTRIEAQEMELTAAIEAQDLTVTLKGTLDRVDRREGGVVILDYKTGSTAMPAKSIWEDMELWERITALADGEADPDLLPELKSALNSVQLPVYVHLYHAKTGETPHDAGLVALAEDGAERLLFGPKWTAQERSDVTTSMIPTLLKALITDMLLAEQFSANTGRHCDWCDYRDPCGR